MPAERFTYPFCYKPHPDIAEAARKLISRISSDPLLHSLFKEGKMLGALKTDGGMLYAFSGLAGGKGFVEGFVPPIFDSSAVNLDSSSPEESKRLQRWLFSQYVVLNALGESRSILDIFADRFMTPPGGTGECAAPKLLHYAYKNGLKPLAMGEFWYGASPEREVRRQGCFYPSCTGKCGPLLTWMMQGLEVAPNPLDDDSLWSMEDPVVKFEDSHIIIVNKPAGMLAVPGRTARRSLQERLSELCGHAVYSCHRLDMDTSGLMVFAKDSATQSALQRQFEERAVSKAYLAIVDPPAEASATSSRGKIVLPLYPDYYDRPRQIVDSEKGRPAVTEYEVLKDFEDGRSLVRLIPYTGRTHQLRVHCAHQRGLGRPIAGDRLYGGSEAARLMLHACSLGFRHPVTGERMTFLTDDLDDRLRLYNR